MINNSKTFRRVIGFTRGLTYALPFLMLVLFVIANIGSTAGMTMTTLQGAFDSIVTYLDTSFSSGIEPIYNMLTSILEFFGFDLRDSLGFFDMVILYMCYFIYVKFLWLLVDVVCWFINLGERLIRKFSGD